MSALEKDQMASAHDHPEDEKSIQGEFKGRLLFPFDVNNGENCVYVGVGDRLSSVDALYWTLKNAVLNESITNIYLIHVFPDDDQIRFIPSPLGMFPRSQVNPEQVEIYIAEEKVRRKELLQELRRMCSVIPKVKVKILLVRSDMVAKAILDLIPILNIRKLVLGANKTSRRKLRTRRVSETTEQILQNAPDFCEIRIICDG